MIYLLKDNQFLEIMKIQLTSFSQRKDHKYNSYTVEDVANVINSSKADILLFGGAVIENITAVSELQSLISNQKILCLISTDVIDRIENWTFILRNGKLERLPTKRKHFSSNDTVDNELLVDDYLTEIEAHRIVPYGEHRILFLQGSEINVLDKVQGEKRIEFCGNSLPQVYEDRWSKIFNEVDIILQMCYKEGKPSYKLQVKKLISDGNKSFFSVANSRQFIEKCHFASFDGNELEGKVLDDELGYSRSWLYEI